MKSRTNAKQKREADIQKRKNLWSPKKDTTEKPAADIPAAPKPAIRKTEELPQLTPEEETRMFLEYLERNDRLIPKDNMPEAAGRKRKASAGIGVLNLEEGMPTVEEAIRQMDLGIQEMKVSKIKTVKLIHGYGSTGRGGKICSGVRKELAEMKRKNLIRDYIPGENFGPLDAASRKLAETEKQITRDPDYGRMNHGITVVVL